MQQQQQQQQQQHQASHQTGGRQAQHHLSPPPQLPAAAAVSTSGHVVSSNNVNVGNVGNMNNLGNVGVASVAVGHGFELEEALFATAPVGIHCVDANGVVLWANRTELNFLGFATKEEYVGRYVSSFVYSDKVKNDAAANNATNNSASTGGNGNNGNNNILGGQGGSTMGAVVGDTNLQQQQQQPEQQQQQGGGDPNVNLITADDKTLYKEVLKRVTGGNPISEIPVRFVTRSGTVIHLLLDCDGNGILQRHNTANNNNGRPGPTTGEYYYRFFTRDDTSRRIQEMRSNVLFQETNRSLQMLDNFMNRWPGGVVQKVLVRVEFKG